MKNKLITTLLLAVTALSAQAAPFGSQLFNGNFKTEQFSGFNPDYQLAIGDKVNLKLWGAYSFEGSLTVDPQGNIFVPNSGPVKVQGVRNNELQAVLARKVSAAYKANVGVYATLDAAQPVKIFVTGMVQSPGLYSGVAADSVLRFLDKAGGVDPARGAFTEISLMRNGLKRATFNLYEFLSTGKLDMVQLNDGDVIVVSPRKQAVTLRGQVFNEADFELTDASPTLASVLKLAKPKAGATHARITRKVEGRQSAQYYALADAASISVLDGDDISVTSDTYKATILVSVKGNHQASKALVLPYGATVKDVLDQVSPGAKDGFKTLQLYRASVAARQKEMLNLSLDKLESLTLNSTSQTNEAATLRTKEAELARQFIERARKAEFKGQVILNGNPADMRLEDGDELRLPEQSSVVMVHGEVLFPSAIAWAEGKDVAYYIGQSGGATSGKNKLRILIMKPNGEVIPSTQTDKLEAGDEIMALPKVEAKNIETVRAVTQILYQLAVGARTLLLW
jgi:protein involved in polysaccharide export with SLBB domain